MAKKTRSLTQGVVVQLLTTLVEGKSAATRKAYEADVDQFAAYLNAPTAADAVIRLLRASRAQARTMLQQYRDRIALTLKASSVRRRLGTMLIVVHLAADRALIQWKECDVVPSTPEPMRAGNQVHLFVARLAEVAENDQAPTRRTKALRDLAIVRLLHDLGLPPSAVAALDVADLALAQATPVLRVDRDHGPHRDLLLPEGTGRALKAWLQQRGIQPGPLFPSLDRARKGTGRMSSGSLAQAITTAGARLGVEITPAAIKASAIEAALLATGGDYKSVAAHFGITDPRTLAQHDPRESRPSNELAQMIAEDLP